MPDDDKYRCQVKQMGHRLKVCLCSLLLFVSSDLPRAANFECLKVSCVDVTDEPCVCDREESRSQQGLKGLLVGSQ